MDFGRLVALINDAMQGHHEDLEHQFHNVWENQFTRISLDHCNRFIQRLNERRSPRNLVTNDDPNSNMDRVLIDPATHEAWYLEHAQIGIPGRLMGRNPVSANENAFFQIEIVSTGEEGNIAIGLAPRDYQFGNQPGWRQQSIGYHADDGGIYIEAGSPCKRKEKCGLGDRMGCGIEMKDGRQFVFFTKNGDCVAEQPFDVGTELFPVVGMNSPGERVRLLEFDMWGIQPEEAAAMCGDNVAEEDEEIDLTITQTGHISFFWQNGGYRDIMIPASVPFSPDKAFFEIEVFAVGDDENISIGLVPKDYSRKSHPGWLPNSTGYHIAGGQFFTGRSTPQRTLRERCTVGDKIGCGLETNGHGAQVIFFTKNGQSFLEEEIILPGVVYPAVGLRSAGKTVSICIQGCDAWGFENRETRPRQGSSNGRATNSKRSAVKCDTDSSTARLDEIPGETNTATLIANKHFSEELMYFEFEFVGGESVAIGVVSQDYDVEELPGCHPKSIGYHSDDGGVYKESGRTSIFVDPCSHGDVMGCGIAELSNGQQQTFYFSRNGKTVYEISLGNADQKLYPAIGMKSEHGHTHVLIQDMNIWNHPQCASSTDSGEKVTKDEQHPPDRTEALRKELECPICWRIFEKPKMFPCQQHYFCTQCLRSYVQGTAPNGTITCPVCRKVDRLPMRGVDGFQDNPLLNRMVEAFKALK